LSKALGSKTVQSGSVSRGKNDPSQSLQMIERALLTPDELKSLPKGTFVVMKTGFYPMQVRLQLFFKWGIEFPKEAYAVPDKGNRAVAYAKKDILEMEIVKQFAASAGDAMTAEEVSEHVSPKANRPGPRKPGQKASDTSDADDTSGSTPPSESNIAGVKEMVIYFNAKGELLDESYGSYIRG
ncbi:MAG TPA: type IV secretory system conjugative DNA transfer family protein, partial [Bacillota bacterium]|nr:type IV secretory system conjugative DNA transfer family protein [Bacillota bacterium]